MNDVRLELTQTMLHLPESRNVPRQPHLTSQLRYLEKLGAWSSAERIVRRDLMAVHEHDLVTLSQLTGASQQRVLFGPGPKQACQDVHNAHDVPSLLLPVGSDLPC
jgi:hypothetical protein